MNIINFISGKDLGGPKQSFILYTEALVSSGHDVVSVVRKGAQVKAIMDPMGFDVREVNYLRASCSLFRKMAISKIRDTFEPINADLVFVHKPMDIGMVRETVGDKVKIIGIIHGFDGGHTADADALIAVSEKVKEFLLEMGISKPIYVVPNMVKIDKTPEYREIPEVPLIGAMGVYRRKKGFHMLIEALGILKREGIAFKAVIAGKGQLYYYYKYLQRKFDLNEELTIRGWVGNEERDLFVDSIDLYILPSRTETFGMVVVEAMARMKRVIATKCGGPEEIIKDGVNGYLVEKQSPQAMADKIVELLLNPDKTNKVAVEANQEALSKYTIAPVTSILNKVVIETLQ